jgi:hypothetical protein
MNERNDKIMEIKYTKQGDYNLPNLTINNKNYEGKINKYGYLRLEYLKQNNRVLYTSLLMKSELENHLISVSKISEDMLNILMESYKKQDEKLTEKNKSLNQFEWVKLMNNYKNCAKEIIKTEIIFV